MLRFQNPSKRVLELDFRIRETSDLNTFQGRSPTEWIFCSTTRPRWFMVTELPTFARKKQQCGHLQVNLPCMEHLVIAMRQYLEHNLLFISINFIWKTSLASCLKTWYTLCNFSLLWLVMLHWPTEKNIHDIEPCFGLHRSDGPTVSHFPGWSSPKRSWNRENGRLESTVENPLKNRYRMMAFHGFPFNHKDFIGIHHHFPRSFPRS